MFGYRVPPPDKAMLISGRKRTPDKPYKVIVGHGAWVIPGLRQKVDFLGLDVKQAEVKESCTTTEGFTVNVGAVVVFRVPNDEDAIIEAAQNFLRDQQEVDRATGRDRMTGIVGLAFAGHLRSIVGAMTISDMIRKREAFAQQVLDASKVEVSGMGLQIKSFQINHIDDNGSGIIDAMAKPHQAEIERTARIAAAAANQASAEKEQESERNQAGYITETQLKKAKLNAEIQAETEKASQAGPLAQAQAREAVLIQERKLAERQAELTEAQLLTQVVKPAEAARQKTQIDAEAEAARVKTLADAEAHRIKTEADALAANDRVNLDQQLLQLLPQIVAATASSVKNANLNILNGTEGLNDLTNGLIGQGLTVFKMLRGQLAETTGSSSVDVDQAASKLSELENNFQRQ